MIRNNKKMEHILLNAEIKIKKNNFFQLKKDLEAMESFIKNVFNPNYMKFNSQYDRVKWMIDKNYYVRKLTEWYTKKQINELGNYIKSFNHEFKSYMAAKKFLDEYAVKSRNKKIYLENYNDRVVVIALYLGQGNFKKAKNIAEVIITGKYQPATPTFQDSGVYNQGDLVSCFLLEMDDNLESIVYNLGNAMHLSKVGGGIAIDLTRIRPRGSKLRGIEGVTAGVLPIMKLMEDSFSLANKMDQRNGAGAAYLNIFHYDVLEFLDTKKINADEKSRIQLLSLGLQVPNKFFDLAKKNDKIALFSSYDIAREYNNKSLNEFDMDVYYDIFLKNKKIKKQYYDARRLLLKIAQIQMESGYPYIIYLDNVNKQHPLKNLGKVKMSNLCTEIFQVQEISKISNVGEKNQIGRDVSCNLGSLNIVNVMESKKIEETVSIAMDCLTAVVELSNIKIVPGIKKANDELHSIGLGALNLHGYFVKNNLMYESEEAKEFANVFFAAINYYSLKRSMEIAIKKKETFKGFEKSDYAKGIYFDKYLENDFLPITDKVKKLFEGIKLPTAKDWKHLKQKIMKNGIWHAYRMAIAPNQSTGYIANATSSVMPITSIIESRIYGNSTTYYPMPYLKPQNVLLYKNAYLMDQKKVIDLISEIQQHIDQGISTILFVDSDTTTKELVKLYLYAFTKNLKSLYYTRASNLTLDECEVCMV